MHARLLAFGVLLLVIAGAQLDGGTARSAHKHPWHLVSSHFDAPGWDEVICVEIHHWWWGTELEYQYTSTYTQLIMDVIARPGEGWNYRPDSRIKLFGLWDYGRGRWMSCKELDPTYRANHVDIEVYIKWETPQAMCPYSFIVGSILAGGCSEGHPNYYIPDAHPPATNLYDWGKYGISFRSDRLDANQVGASRVHELINHEFGHVWGLGDPESYCPNDPYTAPNQEGSVMHSTGYGCWSGPAPWRPTYLDIDSAAGQMDPPPTLTFSAPYLGFPTPTPAPSQPPPTATRTRTPTPSPTPRPTWTPTPKPVADLELLMQPRSDAIPAGSWLVYDIRFRNIGPGTATNVAISAQLPIGLEYVTTGTYFAPGFTCNFVPLDRSVICQAPSLAPTTAWSLLQLQLRVTLQQTHNLTATIQANPSTDDPPQNNVRAVGITGVAMTCSPRPTIDVATVPNGDGRLRVTVSIDNPTATQDRLERLAFGTFQNAVVDIGSAQGLTGNQTYTLGSNEESVTFYVRRLVPGPATVPLRVMDHCDSAWETFVGGGASAF